MENHRIKMHDISVDRVHNILHKELEMKKFCAWMPRLLTIDQKHLHSCNGNIAFELLLHQLYSPDLAPYDFFLFPNLKIWLEGQQFSSNQKVITTVNAYFEGLETSYFSDEFKKLEHRWIKCVGLQEGYVKKWKKIFSEK